MNLLKIASREKKEPVEVDTADLSVEEFAELRRLLDLSGIMEARDDPSLQAGSPDTVTIKVTTADGVHDHTVSRASISSELEELIDLIKYLGKVHQPIDFAHPASQPRVSSMS